MGNPKSPDASRRSSSRERGIERNSNLWNSLESASKSSSGSNGAQDRGRAQSSKPATSGYTTVSFTQVRIHRPLILMIIDLRCPFTRASSVLVRVNELAFTSNLLFKAPAPYDVVLLAQLHVIGLSGGDYQIVFAI